MKTIPTRALGLGVAALMLTGTAQAGLVFKMDFNDADGNQSLLDRGTTGVIGSFTGGSAYSTTVPPVNSGGYSGSFDGLSGAADFGDIDALDGLSSITITAWIRMNSAGQSGAGRIVNKRSSDGPDLYYNSTASELEFVANTTPVANGGGAIGFGSWKFVAVTYDGTDATFYTGDGTTLSAADTDPTANGALTANANSLLIGNHSGGARTFDGLIDNLRIYNTVEDAASLTRIMQYNDAAGFYQSDFTGTTLDSAGLVNAGGASDVGDWYLDDTNDRAGFDWKVRNARATLYTLDSWQNDIGFILDVSFQHDDLNPSRFGFGLVTDTYTPSGDVGWLSQADIGAYGIGFTTHGTTADNAGGDVLAFSDGSTAKNDFNDIDYLSTAQGNITDDALQTISITVRANTWSYSLNGAEATTGTFSTPFDTSRSYRFIAYQQSTSSTTAGGGEDSYFSNITLTPIYVGTLISIK